MEKEEQYSPTEYFEYASPEGRIIKLNSAKFDACQLMNMAIQFLELSPLKDKSKPTYT